MSMKTKLSFCTGRATHFLRWEVPYFRKHFDVVSYPGHDVILLAFGPDVLETAARLPALRRVAMLFPGFGRNPYHNLDYRAKALSTIESCYDLVFVNPGPLAEAYKSSEKVVTCSFTIDTKMIKCAKLRKSINSLIHVSADYPQKDWQRSELVMKMTSLPYEVFPPRSSTCYAFMTHVERHLNWYSRALGLPAPFRTTPAGYVPHRVVAKKYQQYDGFVHVAAEIPDAIHIDGKYTAALLEAGVTGAILFWHDTLGLGNDLETVFDLPVEPAAAASHILEIRSGLNVERHSRMTRDEIIEKYDPARSVECRASKIKELL
jgi:hypothetical protein